MKQLCIIVALNWRVCHSVMLMGSQTQMTHIIMESTHITVAK